MELGEKIRQARLEAGLSQRQLCGDRITRNMLSQIEHGTAKPSMETLRYLAGGLGKPVSYFLEDQAVTSPNQEVMTRGREAFQAGDPAAALDALAAYRTPDPVFDHEAFLLRALCGLALAEQALQQARLPYARGLLERAGEDGSKTPYYAPELERRRILLLAQAAPEETLELAKRLPPDDRELLLRAEAAMAEGDTNRAGVCLDAAQNREDPRWQLLRGEVWFLRGEHHRAAECFRLAEAAYPRQAAARLEVCYRELGDFRLAYEYACKQR